MNHVIIWRTFAMLLLISGLVFTGCKKDTTSSNNDDLSAQDVQQNATATYYATTYMEAMVIPASALATSADENNTLQKSSGMVSDTLYDGCPTAVFYPVRRKLTLNWGGGCTGSSGLYCSGAIHLESETESSDLTFKALFENFTCEGYRMTGDVRFVVKKDEITVTIQNGVIAKDGVVYSVTGNLKVLVQTNNTPQDPYDDLYTIYGNLQTACSEPPPLVTDIVIRNSAPVKYRPTCAYPHSGIVDLTNNGRSTGYADFSPANGGCDDVVVIYSSGGRLQKTIHMDEL